MIYLLHFEPRYRHAGHYLGFTDDLFVRYETHIAGHGSPLVRAAIAAGCTVTVAATFEGDRNRERRLHNRKSSPRLCPVCRGELELEEGRHAA